MRPLVLIAVVLMSSSTLAAQEGFFAVEGTGQRYATAHDAVTLGPIEKRLADLEAKVAAFKSCQCEQPVKQAEAPAQPKSNGWSITMETIDNCKACEHVDLNDRPRYVRDGWEWKTVRIPQPLRGSIYPRFIVCNGSSCYVIDGMRFTNELDGRVRQAIAELSQSQAARELRQSIDFMSRMPWIGN